MKYLDLILAGRSTEDIEYNKHILAPKPKRPRV